MTDPVSAANSHLTGQYGQVQQKSPKIYNIPDAQARDLKAEYKSGDQVSISHEAMHRQEQAEDAKEAGAGSWEKRFGLQAGTTVLGNSNKQVVTIKGSHLEILEYKGDRLVQKTIGEMDADGAVLDTELYSAGGQVKQTIHSEFSGLNDVSSTLTQAGMSRTIQWFENGELTRRMQDEMRLSSQYLNIGEGFRAKPKDLESLVNELTWDRHKTGYSAGIQEYSNGRLVQDIALSQKNTHFNQTDRRDRSFDGQEHNTTWEKSRSTFLEVSVRSFDVDGNLVREVNFDDRSDNDTLKQSLSVSWYNKGELVKKSQGSLTMEEGENTNLDHRPSILDTLQVDEKPYSSAKPNPASQLLIMGGALDAASDAGHYTNTLEHDAATGYYDPAGRIARFGVDDTPYSLSLTNEIYKEGELAARQEDKESARLSPLPDKQKFRTGMGLTEDDTPALLRQASHSGQSFENGQVVNQAVVEYGEFVDEEQHGPDKIKTYTRAEQGKGLDRQVMESTLQAGLGELDKEHHKASRGFSMEVDLTMNDLVETFESFT